MASASGGMAAYLAAAKTKVVGKKIVLNLSKDDDAISWNVSRDELSKLVYEKMGIPEGKIDAIDDSMFKKIVVYLKPGVDNNDYLTTSTYLVRPGLKVEPTRAMDGLVAVRIFWTAFDLDNGEIKNALSFFGDVVGEIEYMNFGKGNTSVSDKLRNVKTGNRVVKMKIKKNIPSYILIGGKKAKVIYNGQLKTCARCHKVAEHCPGESDASKCDNEGGDRRDIMLTYDQIIEEAKEVNIGYQLNAEYMDLAGFPEDWCAPDVRDWLLNEGLDITFEHLKSTEFKGIWRLHGKDDEFYKQTNILLAGKKIGHKNKIKIHAIQATPEKSSFQIAKEKIDEEFRESQREAREEKERKEKKEKEKQEKAKKKKEEQEKKKEEERKKKEEKKKEEERKKKEEERKKKEQEEKKKKDKKDDEDKKGGGKGGGTGGNQGGDTGGNEDDEDDSDEDLTDDDDDETFVKADGEAKEELGARPDPIGSPKMPDDSTSFVEGVRRSSTPDAGTVKITLRKHHGSFKVKTPAPLSKRKPEGSPEEIETTTSSKADKKGRKWKKKKLQAELDQLNATDFVDFQVNERSAKTKRNY